MSRVDEVDALIRWRDELGARGFRAALDLAAASKLDACAEITAGASLLSRDLRRSSAPLLRDLDVEADDYQMALVHLFEAHVWSANTSPAALLRIRADVVFG